MSTVYENTVDTLREVGERLAHDVPSNLPTVRLPSALVPSAVIKSAADWPEEITERLTGRRRKRGGVVGRHPVLVVGGALALVLAGVWFVRRRRQHDLDQGLRVADQSVESGAA
jgi:LPXTG-motif cell wall-anchored protein